MAAIWKEGTTDYFVISTNRDSQGISDWNISLVDLATGTVEDETANVTVTEVEHTIATPATGDVAAETLGAAKTLTLGVGEGANFSRGMAVEYTTASGTEYNSVKSVSGDTLTLNKPLGDTVAAAVTVTQTGLTGDYRVVVDQTALTSAMVAGGSYQFQVKAPSANIDIASEIFDITDYSINDELGGDITTIKQALDNLAGGGSSAKVHM
jgi:hypothetical protein